MDLATRSGKAAANRALKGTASLLTRPFERARQRLQSWFRGPSADVIQPIRQLAGRMVEPRAGSPPVVPGMVPMSPLQRPGSPPLPQMRYSPSTQSLRDLALDILGRSSINDLDADQLAQRVMALLRTAKTDPAVSPDSRRALEDILAWLEHRFRPPAAPPAAPVAPSDADEEDEIQVLGRADINSWTDQQIRESQQGEIFTPQSSNVYSYFWVSNAPMGRSATGGTNGTLFVTFKAWHPGQKGRPNMAGPCYAYSNVNLREYQGFSREADSSAGGAVWDYLRVRGTRHGHQHPYRLVAGVQIPEGGEYVPRQVTAGGFRRRMLLNPRTGWSASTLDEQRWDRQATMSYRDWQAVADQRNADAGRPVVDRGRPTVNRGRP